MHVDILFIAFLTDQTTLFEKTQQLKGEYLWAYITHPGWWAIALELVRLSLAALMTYLMIWVIPKYLSAKSYEEELDIEYKLRQMKIDKEESLNKREKKVVKEQLENIQTEKRVVAERAKLDETPEQAKWDLEFSDFIKIRNAKKALQAIKNTVYGEGGNLFQYTDASGWAREPKGVEADDLALADTNDLVTFADKRKLLALTPKGKYFIKKTDSL